MVAQGSPVHPMRFGLIRSQFRMAVQAIQALVMVNPVIEHNHLLLDPVAQIQNLGMTAQTQARGQGVVCLISGGNDPVPDIS